MIDTYLKLMLIFIKYVAVIHIVVINFWIFKQICVEQN